MHRPNIVIRVLKSESGRQTKRVRGRRDHGGSLERRKGSLTSSVEEGVADEERDSLRTREQARARFSAAASRTRQPSAQLASRPGSKPTEPEGNEWVFAQPLTRRRLVTAATALPGRTFSETQGDKGLQAGGKPRERWILCYQGRLQFFE